MTRKDYVAIAEVFKEQTKWLQPEIIQNEQQSYNTLRHLAKDLCDVFERDNPLFDRDRFLKACGFSDDN